MLHSAEATPNMVGSGYRALPLLTALMLLAAPPCRAGPVCLDAAGQPVDWWLALKLPGGPTWAHLDSRAAAEHLGEALGGSEHVEGRFRFSSGALGDSASNSSLTRTLGQLYADRDPASAYAAGHLMFNSRAEGAGHNCGPANGVAGYGVRQGFLLLHTVPGFPLAPPHHSAAGLPVMEAATGHRFLAAPDLAGELAAAAEVGGSARGVAWGAELLSLAGERFMALAAAETGDLWGEVVLPRLEPGAQGLLTIAPCQHRPANSSAFEAPHGRSDWAISAPAAEHAPGSDAKEQRFRAAASAAGTALPSTFAADFDEVARDFAEGAGGDTAAGARLAAVSFNEGSGSALCFAGNRFVWEAFRSVLRAAEPCN
ncbi:hypothetical protein WJX81_002927 [Elliptochloris bilobata]|uniref:Uncharacterized protein n=1 Tax=Elliptochloris bilobata TaxID=381761 RepID=A0AAW1QX42_9CHLO